MISQPHILMCRPEFYGVEYEINPWMDSERDVDHALAMQQWERLYRLLEEAGTKVSLVPPVKGLPDLVFTANAAMIFKARAILSRFRHPQRQGEEQHNAVCLSDHGYNVELLAEDMFFEGAGDALFCGDTLYAGYRIRSDARGLQSVGAMVERRVIPLELVDPFFYHLDTCFCPIANGVAAYFPTAFDEYGKQVLVESIADLIEVEADEARRFACNAVVLGQKVFTNVGCPKLAEAIESRGFELFETPLDEFVKAGGSAKCLTLRLDGEDAAGWKLSNENSSSVE